MSNAAILTRARELIVLWLNNTDVSNNLGRNNFDTIVGLRLWLDWIYERIRGKELDVVIKGNSSKEFCCPGRETME